jgi:hypothetical protein
MEPQVQELLKRIDRLSDQFAELREGIQKAVRVAPSDPEMALIRAPKVLEYVIRDVFERRIGEPPGTRPLENLVQRLAKDGHLPARLEAYAETIRKLGNVGAHRFGESITTADVYQSLVQLSPILEWYFEKERPGPAVRVEPPVQAAPAVAELPRLPFSQRAKPWYRRNRTTVWVVVVGVLLLLAGSLALRTSLDHEPTGKQMAQADPPGGKTTAGPQSGSETPTLASVPPPGTSATPGKGSPPVTNPSPAGQLDNKEQARHFLDLCRAEQFTEATQKFDATMKQALPADKLAEVWKGLIKQSGPLEKMGPPRTDKIKTSTRVKIRCDFKTTPLDAVVSFNAGGQIEGFFLVPAGYFR